jgi:hypothetical protein
MPKLNSTKAAEVKKAGEEGAFPLFPLGMTRMKLVDVTTGNARSGAPMWTWELRYLEHLEPNEEHPDPTKYADKTFRYFTVVQDNTLWDLDRVFAAFDAEPDTDTDDLLGDDLVVVFDQSIATGGRAKGEMQSEIVKFYTLKDGLAAADAIKATSGRSTAKSAKATKTEKASTDTPAF